VLASAGTLLYPLPWEVRTASITHRAAAPCCRRTPEEKVRTNSSGGGPRHSTVTLFARFRGLSTSVPRAQAV
jgi:hypothetical protein